jgi:NAD(P)-dependent dehydrogenase (short-subunit alcohol dehydrogenase family)
MTKEDFEKQFQPNVWGVFVCAQAAALLWKEHDYRNGRIIFVSCERESRDTCGFDERN